MRELIKFAKENIWPNNTANIKNLMRQIRRQETNRRANPWLVYTKDDARVKYLMTKDSFLAFLIDPEGFIRFLEETGLIQYYFYLNRQYRQDLINQARDLHAYMEQQSLTPDQIQETYRIAEKIIRFIEPNMKIVM